MTPYCMIFQRTETQHTHVYHDEIEIDMTTTAVNTLAQQNSGQQHVVMQTPAPVVDNTVFLCGDISANMCLGQTVAGHGTSHHGLHYGLNDDGGGGVSGSGNASNSNMIMESDAQ